MRSFHPWIHAAVIFTGMLQDSVRGEMFLNIPGEPGSSTTPRYVGWSDLFAFNTRQNTYDGVISQIDYTLVKNGDGTSPSLVSGCLAQRRYDTILIHATQDVGMQFRIFEIKLIGAKVTSAAMGATPGRDSATGPYEEYRLRCERLEWTCTEIRDARPVAASTLTWDNTTRTGSTTDLLPLDTDNDGMPDEYELAVGLNPNLNDAALDTDGDGMNNLLEYHAGTDPRSANSVFRTTLQVRPDGLIQLSWPSLAGKTYKVHSSATLAPGSWELHATIPSAGDGTTTCTIPPASANCFFRVETP